MKQKDYNKKYKTQIKLYKRLLLHTIKLISINNIYKYFYKSNYNIIKDIMNPKKSKNYCNSNLLINCALYS